MAEGTIRALKKVSGRNMVQSGSTKQIWYDVLEFEAYVRSYTALDVYMPEGGVPETVMLGGTSDIRQFFEYEFYDWILFRDKPIQYPDENQVLGRYFGPAIDVGLEMMANTMKVKGKVIHCSTYHGLKDEDKSSQVHMSLRKDFDNSIREKFGSDISLDDFPDASLLFYVV